MLIVVYVDDNPRTGHWTDEIDLSVNQCPARSRINCMQMSTAAVFNQSGEVPRRARLLIRHNSMNVKDWETFTGDEEREAVNLHLAWCFVKRTHDAVVVGALAGANVSNW